MSDLSSWKRANMRNAVNLIQDVQYRAVDVTKDDVFLSDADWNYVKNYIEINDPYEEKASSKMLILRDSTTTNSMPRPTFL